MTFWFFYDFRVFGCAFVLIVTVHNAEGKECGLGYSTPRNILRVEIQNNATRKQ